MSFPRKNIIYCLKLAQYPSISIRSEPGFYWWLSNVLASERKGHICRFFSHWLRPCSSTVKNGQGIFSTNGVLTSINFNRIWKLPPQFLRSYSYFHLSHIVWKCRHEQPIFSQSLFSESGWYCWYASTLRIILNNAMHTWPCRSRMIL